MIELTAEQQTIAAAIDTFVRNRRVTQPWYCYQGLAGTGKSVLLGHIARTYPDALLCAFTGKAASVIARKSGLQAQTIHSALYQCYGEHHETKELRFGRVVDDGEWTGRLVLVDEASTVNEWLARDLLRTGCKVIACGDHGQLPPVKGDSYFMRGEADAVLHEVHRQAWDSAIIRQAHYVRGGGVCHSDGDEFQIKAHISRDEIMQAGVILCYRNRTRIDLNRMVRAHKGFAGIGIAGEPVMALQNNPDWGILNGAVYSLQENHVGGSRVVVITNERGETVAVEDAWIEDMEAPLLMPEGERSNAFAWGYVCTVHKAQGSEWDRIILVDEYDKAEQRERWLYTGITRAAKQIIVQRFW